jgi:WD40 repeat protein
MQAHRVGRSILALNSQGRVMRWQGAALQDPQAEFELGEEVFSALFSPDGRCLVVAMANGRVRLWDVQQRTLRHEWGSEGSRAFPVGFIPPSNHLLTRRLGEDELASSRP